MTILRANPRSIPLPFRFGAVVGFPQLPNEFAMIVAPVPRSRLDHWVSVVLTDVARNDPLGWKRGDRITISPYDTGVNIVDDGPET